MKHLNPIRIVFIYVPLLYVIMSMVSCDQSITPPTNGIFTACYNCKSMVYYVNGNDYNCVCVNDNCYDVASSTVIDSPPNF